MKPIVPAMDGGILSFVTDSSVRFSPLSTIAQNKIHASVIAWRSNAPSWLTAAQLAENKKTLRSWQALGPTIDAQYRQMGKAQKGFGLRQLCIVNRDFGSFPRDLFDNDMGI